MPDKGLFDVIVFFVFYAVLLGVATGIASVVSYHMGEGNSRVSVQVGWNKTAESTYYCARVDQ